MLKLGLFILFFSKHRSLQNPNSSSSSSSSQFSLNNQQCQRVQVSTLTSAKKPEVFPFSLSLRIQFFLILFFGNFLLIFVYFFVVIADLLYKDYNTDQKFTLTTYSPTGIVSFLFLICIFFCCCEKFVFFCFDLLFWFVYLFFE